MTQRSQTQAESKKIGPPSMALLVGHGQSASGLRRCFYSGTTASVRPSTAATRARCPGSIVTSLVLRALHVEPRTSTRPTTPGDNRSWTSRARRPANRHSMTEGRLHARLQPSAQERQGRDGEHAEEQELDRQRNVTTPSKASSPDGQRADAEEDDDETAWRGEFSHDQHETGGEPHPPFHGADYRWRRFRRFRAVPSADKIESSCP